MGNSFGFLLEYNDYIRNIDFLLKEDDINIYQKLTKQRLVEGLIHTFPLNKSRNIIQRRFPELKCEIEPDGEIYIEGDFKELKEYLPIFTNLGYFISKLTFDGSNWIKEFNGKSKPLALFLEPKYDIKIDPIPPILYHSSPKKFEKSIQKIGFIPKTGNKLSNHPERIYFTDSLKQAMGFGRNLNLDFCTYEIDTRGLNINLYQDVNMKNDGYYTLGNVPPKYFKKVYEE